MKIFWNLICVVAMSSGSIIIAESNNNIKNLDGLVEQNSTSYFDPTTQQFVDFESFVIDQQNCSIDFSFAPAMYAEGRKVELTKMLFWSDDLIIASDDNFALCENALGISSGENNNIKCDVFFRDDLGKGDDVLGLVNGLSELLRCDQLKNSDLLLDQGLLFSASKNANCDPDGILHLSTEETRLFQNCLNRNIRLESE